MPAGFWRPNPQDWAVFDLTEAITYIRVAPDGTTTSYGGIQALAEPVIAGSVTDVGGSQMTPETVTWHLKVVDLPPGITPDRGDRIVSVSEDYGGTWVIRDGDRIRNRIRVQVRTQKLVDP